jgi:hypothetical protein
MWPWQGRAYAWPCYRGATALLPRCYRSEVAAQMAAVGRPPNGSGRREVCPPTGWRNIICGTAPGVLGCDHEQGPRYGHIAQDPSLWLAECS